MPQADKKRGSYETMVGELKVTLNEPTEGQLATMRRIAFLIDRAEDGDRQAASQVGDLFLDIADTLVTESDVLNALYKGLATESLQLGDYAGAILGALKHFVGEDDDDDQGGPARQTGTRRARAGTGGRRPR